VPSTGQQRPPELSPAAHAARRLHPGPEEKAEERERGRNGDCPVIEGGRDAGVSERGAASTMQSPNDTTHQRRECARRTRGGEGTAECASATVAFCICALVLISCGPSPPSDETVTAAIATLRPTEGNEVRGTIEFHPSRAGGLVVTSDVEGLLPGPHAYHVHLYGDCSAPDASSAGPHFNFAGSSTNPPDDIPRITGNLGELEADADGRAQQEDTTELGALWGSASIRGRSVVVHSRPNDRDAPPEGNAGPRLACGVIGVKQAGS
jgi:Cu-Zn family superoxide dismutase